MKKTLLFFVLSWSIMSSTLFAQSSLFIDTTYTVEEMVMDFFDTPGITISNVTHTGGNNSIGFFDAGGTDLGLDAGIVFSNGNVEEIDTSANYFSSEVLALDGDVDIDLLSTMGGNGSQSQDAIIIEFDFTVDMSDTLDFNYVMGSEEYPEYVNTNFNDAFAFFISGPGITGPFSNNAYNISVVPGTTSEVAINTVNDGLNSQYYIDNELGEHIAFGGMTTSLSASFVAVEGETYHIKMVIADRGDGAFDSGVFLSFNSLGQNSLLSPPTSFGLSQNMNEVDFNNVSKYARTHSWDFGNGMTSMDRHPAPVYYGLGEHTVTLTTQNYCCAEVYTSTIMVDEITALTANVVTINNPPACADDASTRINFEIIGGVMPYATVEWSPTISDFNDVSPGTYTYTVIDQEGTTITGSVTIADHPDPITLDIQTSPQTNGLNDGSAVVFPLGGTSPFTYLWSNGATTAEINGITGGNYSVTVTDANGCTEIASTFVFVASPLVIGATTINNPLSCFGDQNAGISAAAIGGLAPYTFEISPMVSDWNNLGAGVYTVTVIDQEGEMISTEVTISEPDELILTTDSEPSVGGSPNGSATVTPEGGVAPYTYEWSNGATTATAEDLVDGDYSVVVTDANGCSMTTMVTVSFMTSVFENNDFTIEFFPNPVMDQFQLNWENPSEVVQIEVYDLLGQTVAIDYYATGNGYLVRLNEKILAGTYFLNVQLEDGKRASTLFVVAPK